MKSINKRKEKFIDGLFSTGLGLGCVGYIIGQIAVFLAIVYIVLHFVFKYW